MGGNVAEHPAFRRNPFRRNRCRPTRYPKAWLPSAACGLLMAIALAGCAGRQERSGVFIDEERLTLVEAGKIDREQVRQVLGTPSTTSTFQDANDTWYYVSRETESFAFLKPTVTQQQVVAVDFDKFGQVAQVRRYTLEDGKAVEISDRATPSRGRELTFIEQLLSGLENIGGGKKGSDDSNVP
jgi:outer membrane protein assembly factor BamE (lipoprotein component of BamABCDE complex)